MEDGTIQPACGPGAHSRASQKTNSVSFAPSRRRLLAGTGLGWRHHAAAGL
jgi:hypothetical protein